MAEELVELTAAIQHELELARSGDGYEEAAVAGEIVERMVAPMLAARGASFDQRLSDVQEEYRKSLESWDRSRERLDGRVAYLEARVGELHNTIGEQRAELDRWRSGQRHKVMLTVKEVPDGITYAARLLRAQGTEGGDEHDELLRNAGARLATLTDVARRLLVDRDRVEASRQAWAEQAAALKDAARESYDELGDYIQVLTNTDRPEIAGRRVAATKAQRIIGGYFGAVMADWHDAEDRRVCACVTDEQAEQIKSASPRWVRPQCAVHERCMEGRSDA